MPQLKKVIVLGSKGMLGRYIHRYLEKIFSILDYDVQGWSTPGFVVPTEAFESIPGFIVQHFDFLKKGDIVINCIGLVKKLMGEYPIPRILEVNTSFPIYLSNFLDDKGCELFHISTDCVFSGRDGYYSEERHTDAYDVYGKSKALADDGIGQKGRIIRTSIIGEERPHYQKGLLAWMLGQEKGATVNGYVNHLWNGVTCFQLAEWIYHIIKQDLNWRGVQHYHPTKEVTKHELLEHIRDVYGLDVIVKPGYDKHNINRTLSTESFRRTFVGSSPPIKTQLEAQKKYVDHYGLDFWKDGDRLGQ